MERKYLFEAGLNVYTSFKTLIPVENLSTLEKCDTRKYHLYSILSYPQIFYDSDKTYVDFQGIHITLFGYFNDKKREFNIPCWKIHDNLDYSKVKLAIKYPNITLEIQINDNTFINSHPKYQTGATIYAHELFQTFAEQFMSKIEFEVLYIGQSYGKRGERTAITRLSSHSTLQKILTDCQTKYSDKHIYLLLLEITPLLNMSFDGISKKYTKSIVESDQHMKEVLENLPKEQQIVNITEAALINYFKPEYNRNFVENFPDQSHKGYKQYFDLDYNYFSLEIDLEFDYFPLMQIYSSYNRINSCYENIRYKLYNEPNRKSMYDIFTQQF